MAAEYFTLGMFDIIYRAELWAQKLFGQSV